MKSNLYQQSCISLCVDGIGIGENTSNNAPTKFTILGDIVSSYKAEWIGY